MKDYIALQKEIRIAVISHNYGLTGGAEHYAYELTERLAKYSKFKIHVLANKWHERDDSSIIFHKIPIFTFPRWFKPICFAYFANRIVRSGYFDIIHSHERTFSQHFLSHHGFPHALWVKEVEGKHMSLFDKTTAWVEKKSINANRLSMVLSVSNTGKQKIQKQFHIPDSKISILHPGISIKRFNLLNKDLCRNEIRKRHNLRPDDIIMLFVGMNFELKGLDNIFKSMAAFTANGEKNTNLKLLIVGRGRKNHYKQLAKKLCIDKQVVFAGASNEIEKYFLAGDLCILLSKVETFGMVVLESMLAGLPVIIANTVGARDIVEPNVNGFIINPENYIEEVPKALSILMNIDMRKKMGKSAYRVALHHDWNVVTTKVIRLYMQNLKNRRVI